LQAATADLRATQDESLAAGRYTNMLKEPGTGCWPPAAHETPMPQCIVLGLAWAVRVTARQTGSLSKVILVLLVSSTWRL